MNVGRGYVIQHSQSVTKVGIELQVQLKIEIILNACATVQREREDENLYKNYVDAAR